MAVALFVGISSLVLLVYWFRYTSMLILSTKTSHNYSFEIALTHELDFPQIRAGLSSAEQERFGVLASGLDHDYRLISAMLRNVEPQDNGEFVQDVILQIDFAGLKLAYWLAQRLSEEHTRMILAEMSEIVTHFANAVGERSMAASAAASSSSAA